MASQTGTLQAKHGVSAIWLGVTAFAVAAVLAVVLFTIHGAPAPSTPAKQQTQQNGAPSTERIVRPATVPHCHQCTP